MKKLSWKNKFFSSTYYFSSENSEAGFLKLYPLRRKGEGELNMARIRFETKGFFNPVTHLTNSSNDSEIGTITYNHWKQRATLVIAGREFTWKFNNFWHTRWGLYIGEMPVLSGKGSFNKGELESEIMDPVCVLASFYIKEYFSQSNATASAAG